MLSQVPGIGSLRFFSNSRPRWPANLMSSRAWRMPRRSRTPRPSSTGFDLADVSAMSLMWTSWSRLEHLRMASDRVDPGPGGVADVDAEADPGVERLDGLPDVEGRRPDLVLGAVVVDRELDVVFLDELVEDRHRLLLGAANDGRDAGVLGVLEGRPDARLVLTHADVAAAQGGDPGILEFLGAGLALVLGALEREVGVLDRAVVEVDPLDRRDRLVGLQLGERVGGDPHLQAEPGVTRLVGRLEGRGGRGEPGERRQRGGRGSEPEEIPGANGRTIGPWANSSFPESGLGESGKAEGPTVGQRAPGSRPTRQHTPEAPSMREAGPESRGSISSPSRISAR